MAVFETAFSTEGGGQYRVIVDAGDGANGSLPFRVIVVGRRSGMEEWHEVAVDVTLDVAGEKIEIRDRGELIAAIPLVGVLPDVAGMDPQVAERAEEEAVDNALADAAERLLGLIPTDQLIGCLVKGAVTTLVGQLIRCWGAVEHGDLAKLFGDMTDCLKRHGWRMVWTFATRWLRCAAGLLIDVP